MGLTILIFNYILNWILENLLLSNYEYWKANMNLLMRSMNDFLLLKWIYFKRKYLIIILWYNVEFCKTLLFNIYRWKVGCYCLHHALGAWLCVLGSNSPFFRRFASGPEKNRIPPTVKSHEATWIFILGFPKVFTNLRMFLICRFVWILHELLQNPLKFLYFREIRITYSNIENIPKVLKSLAIALILLLFAVNTY